MGLTPVSESKRPQDLHAALHRVGGKQHLGHEQDAVAEVDADDPHAFDQRLVEHLFCGPVALEQDARSLDDLLPQAVVEVFVHLLGEFVVVQFRQDDVFLFQDCVFGSHQ